MQRLINELIEYNTLDPRRVNHALKVHSFARSIALNEGVDVKTLQIIEAAAILHDIGIRICEAKYQSTEGSLQEKEGVIIAKPMLEKYIDDEQIIDRVLFIIGHHHHYKDIDGIDFQIIVEADLIVNIYEDNVDAYKIKEVKEKFFKTKTGTNYLSNMYLTKDSI